MVCRLTMVLFCSVFVDSQWCVDSPWCVDSQWCVDSPGATETARLEDGASMSGVTAIVDVAKAIARTHLSKGAAG